MARSPTNVNAWNRNRLLHVISIRVGAATHWEGTVAQYIRRRRAAMWRASEGRATAEDREHWISAPAVAKLTVTEQEGVSVVNREAYSAQMADRRLRR
jgi:hypothetical protein